VHPQPKAAPEGANRPVSVTGKVMAILDAFAPGDVRLRLTEICHRAGLPLATGHRLVGELCAGGFLERVGGGYRIGIRLWRIGAQAATASGLRELALPHMEDLYEVSHENVQLAVVRNAHALYLERLRGPRSVPIVTRVGLELPLHATGVGKILLAYSDDGLREQVLAGPLAAHTPHTITDPAVLEKELVEVVRNGYAITREEMTLGSHSIGAPVFGSSRRLVAALSVVTRMRSDHRMLVPAVVTAARALSRDVAASQDAGRTLS
jgi:DNA-binding IclR family transcriptional regulator